MSSQVVSPSFYLTRHMVFLGESVCPDMWSDWSGPTVCLDSSCTHVSHGEMSWNVTTLIGCQFLKDIFILS